MTDLAQALRKFIDQNFITVNGNLVEVLPDHKFKWNGFTGSFPEVAERIRKARVDLKNSLKQKHTHG